MNQLSKNLHNLRKGMGLTLDDLSKATDISISMLSKIERGECSPTVELLLKITKYFKISLSEIAGDPGGSEIVVTKKSSFDTERDKTKNSIITYISKSSTFQKFDFVKISIPPNKSFFAESKKFGSLNQVFFICHGKCRFSHSEKEYSVAEGEAINLSGIYDIKIFNSDKKEAVIYGVISY